MAHLTFSDIPYVAFDPKSIMRYKGIYTLEPRQNKLSIIRAMQKDITQKCKKVITLTGPNLKNALHTYYPDADEIITFECNGFTLGRMVHNYNELPIRDQTRITIIQGEIINTLSDNSHSHLLQDTNLVFLDFCYGAGSGRFDLIKEFYKKVKSILTHPITIRITFCADRAAYKHPDILMQKLDKELGLIPCKYNSYYRDNQLMYAHQSYIHGIRKL